MLVQWMLSTAVLMEMLMCCLATGNCDDGWIANNGHCYYVSASKATWHDAKSQCEQIEAYLASVLDEVENKFITTITNLSKADYWLGLLRRDVSESWMWLDGNKMSYGNWLDNKLQASGNCVRMVNGGQWSVTSCDSNITPSKRPVLYICKKVDKQSKMRNLVGSRSTSVGGREGLELILPLVLAAVFIVLVIIIDILAIYYCRRIKSARITRT